MTKPENASYGVERIVKSFGGARALSEVSMSVQSGKVHCLAGENGSGKSTLIKIISGVHAPDSGIINIAGKEFNELSPREAVQEGVQVIFQDFSLLPNLSVAENIALPHRIVNQTQLVTRRETNRIASEALSLIGVEIDIHSPVAEISIASKQLISIARATNLGAKLLFMDEPTTALTRKEINRLFTVVGELRKRGVATVFVSHKIDEIQEICSTITVLRNGEVVAEGPMEEFSAKGISKAMTGQDVSTTRIAPKIEEARKNALEVRNLSSKHTFENINFTITDGEILGVTGLLGSGRTELAEAIFGKYPVDSGEIFVNDRRIKLNSSRDALEAGIGYVPPDRLTQGLFLEQSILRNLVAVGIDSYRSALRILSPKKLSAEGGRWISDFRIKTENPLNPVTSLSGGNQQRVVLAKWLSMNPKLMILNGPTVGVDVGSKREILEIIKERATQGMSFLVVSDDIPELIQICHRVIVINNGRISREFKEKELNESSLYQEIN